MLAISPCTTLQAYTPGLYHLTGNTFKVEDDDVAIAVPPTKLSYNYGDFVLTGTFSKRTSYTGGYILSGDTFQHTTEDVVTNAFETTLTLSSGEQQEIKLFIDEANGISEMKSEKNTTAVYNLSGQRLSKPLKGINIINGKKYIKQ